MLTLLEKLATGFWTTCGRITSLVFPFLWRAQMLRQWSRGLLWTLRFLLVVAFLVALYFVSYIPGYETWIVAPPIGGDSSRLRPFWLPILGFLTYLLICLALWLWRQLGPEADEIEFPDIEKAWLAGITALNEAGIDLTEAPLFLILGKPRAGEAALFKGSKLDLRVEQTPQEASAPIHVFANRDGIYITCPGASLLGRQALILAGQPSQVVADPGGDGAEQADGTAANPENIYMTLKPTGRIKDVQAILARAAAAGRSPSQLTDEEKQEIQLLTAEENVGRGQQAAAKPRPLLLKHREEVSLLKARLQYLCRLIVRSRHPYCPINGILALLPYSSTDTREDADQTASILQLDLATIRQTAQVQCPVFSVVCDLEAATGFDVFLERFPKEQRLRRVGQRFPLAPDLPDNRPVADVIDQSVQWISASLVPTYVYRLFQMETPGGEDYQTTIVGNVKLYRFFTDVRDKQKRLGSLMARGLAVDARDGPHLYGGCYLAATGRDQEREQAFLPGVFRRLIENQNFVAWTTAGREEDSAYGRWTTYGYSIIIVAVVLVFGGVWLILRSP